jgi:hypothetical protein
MEMGGQRSGARVNTQITEEDVAAYNKTCRRHAAFQRTTKADLQERGITRTTLMARIEHNNELEPFGSKDPILLWFKHNSGETVAYHKFARSFSAKKFLDLVIADSDTAWLNDNTLAINKGWLHISTDPQSTHTLEQLMEYEYKKAEKEWQHDAVWTEYAERIRSFHIGRHPDVNNPIRAAKGLPPATDEEVVARGKKPAEGGRIAREEKKQPKAKPSREGVTTLQAVCAALKIEPKEARTALRKAAIPKPAGGWQWSDAQAVPDIKALVDKLKKRGA